VRLRPCPIELGQQEPTVSGWRKRETFNDDDGAPEDGVGVVLAAPWADNKLAIVAINSPLDEVHKLVVHKHGAGPVRVASDGTRPYLFRAGSQTIETLSPIPMFARRDGKLLVTRVRFESAREAVVLSGSNESGKAYKWQNGDPLTVRHEALPVFTDMSRAFLRDMELVHDQLSGQVA
jgi:hypothetical protein